MSQIGKYLITGGGFVDQLIADVGAANPNALGDINVVGGLNINTVGAGNTITINLNYSVDLTGYLEAGTTIGTLNGQIYAGNRDVAVTSPYYFTAKSRGAGAIVTGDYIGTIAFQGHDGTALHAGAVITSQTSGTIALNRIPSNLVFWTHPDAAGVALQRMTIASDGGITVHTFGNGVVLSSAAGLLSSAVPGIAGTVLMSNGAGVAPTWQAITVFTWSREAGAAVAMATNHGYINANAGLTTFTLPAVAAVGEQIAVAGEGAGGWIITQAAGQNIQVGNLSSTIGIGGSVASTNQYDTLVMICRVANTTWSAMGGFGNYTIV